MDLPVIAGVIDLYISDINKFPVLTVDKEFHLAVRLRKFNDTTAAEKLVVSNLRFVVKIAHEYRNYRVKLSDLIQEGNIGLMHAVKKFDPYKGYRLISYAVWWIRAYIQNYIMKSWSLVKIGTTQIQRKLFFKLGQFKTKLDHLSEKNPEFAEIADLLGVKTSELREVASRMSNRDVSLDASVSEDGETRHIDNLVYDGDDQEIALIQKERMALDKRNVTSALTGLTEKEGYIIHHRFMTDDPMTLQEIGNRYHITRERVRQIENQALKKLRLAISYLGNEPPLLEAK